MARSGEVRDFFGFQIPALSGTVTSVTLQIPTGTATLLQYTPLTVTFSSLSTDSSFSAIGAGTTYGSTTYDVSLDGTIQSITLNSSAIADVEADAGGEILIGGAVTSSTIFSATAPDELVYALGGASPVVLAITTDDSKTASPEPTSLALLGTGLLGLTGAASRRGRRR